MRPWWNLVQEQKDDRQELVRPEASFLFDMELKGNINYWRRLWNVGLERKVPLNRGCGEGICGEWPRVYCDDRSHQLHSNPIDST